ncbi:xanthine dehydrogenase molybdopterin binding subunit [Pyxidicoccus xibeiensis]|uniref:xanthine dehydrogenase molybdopterin binding subunit n=1 Tax=Pyxidicoccus xibeiensis TaxID=2906759 RepID=UPI0020A7531C|nr:xanthine dehydrogenase molybdopterin binding subunit [Pyxidicoccus xibeiensis]MCP3143152.1 xanthine dehydrogenase molybdopterin binding subunit [Pyxidicoccus xibeiensis]
MFEFLLNGTPVRVDGVSPNTTLLDFLRARGSTGTKQGCAEGDCGACTVAMVDRDAQGQRVLRAFNSCITLLPMVAGRELVTVEGVGSRDKPHPVQQAMVKHYGSQCGFCTPGFVVSMVEAYSRKQVCTPEAVADQLCGNLCRCTGYRPIRDAMMEALAARDGGAQKEPVPGVALGGPASPLPTLRYEAQGQTFLRPTSMEELLSLKAAHPEALLVAGATELGVDITKKARRYPFLISTEGVESLRAIRREADGWYVGGAASLVELEDALGAELPEVTKMLNVFASRQIRQRATLAGNLVTASPIGDMAPVLLALDASLVLASAQGERGMPLADFFLAYRKTALRPDEVVRHIVIPHPSIPADGRRLSDSFKVSKRRELDISIVAAGFRVELDADGAVRRARLAYGGVAATPIRARRTEEQLTGQPWTRETVERVLPVLAGELSPISDLRGGAEYRRGLIVSMFEKFFSGERSPSLDAFPGFAMGEPGALADAGRELRHESALGHVTGSAQYVDDLAQRQPMLEVWPVCAPHAHARILKRDPIAARKLPGVVAVLMAEDIPGTNDTGPIRHDEPLLADREVLFHGQVVALVVGESIDACRAAARAVVVEYEPLAAILTVEDAMAQGSYHTEPHVIRRGDVDAALASSPHRLSGTLAIGGQEHFYLETHAAFAERGDDGDITVTSSTQHPSEVQAVVSHVLDLPRSRVVVKAPRMGGGFGGKETQGNAPAALVALAAWHTGRPVRWMLDRDVDMTLTGKRHPFHASFEVGFDAQGRLLALRTQLVSNGGWSLDLSESILDRALFHLDNAYYVPTVAFTGRVAKTHLVSNTAFRGFGGPQGMLVSEEVLGRVARALGLPPEEVRERNLYSGSGETNTTHYGQELEDERMPRLWRELKESSDFARRRQEVDAFNARSPRIKRGLALTPMKFGISFTATFLNQAGALVHLYRDGSVMVSHGGTEMGQGLHTKVLGVAMRELGVTADAVRMAKTATDKVPNTSATAASSGSDLNGAAVRNACVTLRERLAPVASRLLSERHGRNVAPEALVFQDGRVGPRGEHEVSVPFAAVVEAAYLARVGLSVTGYYQTPGIGYDKARGRGRPFLYFAYGAAVTEVEVDGYTGMKRVLRVDLLEDVGDSLNPGVDRGQIEGGFVQGLGWLTGEDLRWDANGRLLTHSASTYAIPAFSDAPIDFRVRLMEGARQHNTIHGSKAVGEPPLMLALSAREALRDAVGAFGHSGGEVELASPATHEALFLAIQKRLTRGAKEDGREAA